MALVSKASETEQSGKQAAQEVTTQPPTQPSKRRSYVLITIIFVTLGALLQSPSFSSTMYHRHVSAARRHYAVCSREGNVYTVDSKNPKAECVVVKGRKIEAVGSFETVQALNTSLSTPLPTFFTKPGSIVVPGLSDAHAHIIEYGAKKQLELDGSQSISDVVHRVREFIRSRPDVMNNKSMWIEGMGWDQTRWSPAEFPVAADLDRDELLRGRLIHLRRVDAHASWVSPAVLELMGQLPESVSGGEIIRNVQGSPTGVFLDNAILLIPAPQMTEAQMRVYFETAMRDALQHGLTTIHDAWSTPQMIHFFEKVAEEGSLPMRLYLMGNVESEEYWGDQIPFLHNHGVDRRLNLRAVKLFADGALGSWGAAMLEPYSDKPDSTGLLRSSPEVLSGLMRRFWNDGFQVNVHCIGDRANKIVLDTFEELLNGSADAVKRRPRIEHAQIMTTEDLKRVGRLGVIPSMQPTHATSDMGYAESRLGPDRVKRAYAWKTLLDNASPQVLPIGSDFPVEGVNPLRSFYAAVSRLSAEGTSPHGPGGWYPEERLSREEALKGMTIDAAYASFSEDVLGSLVAGKFADFVVLDHDIMTLPFAHILETKVLATIVDGEVMYGAL